MSKTKLLLLSTALLFCCTEVSFAQSKKKKDAGKEAPKVEQTETSVEPTTTPKTKENKTEIEEKK